MKKFRLTHKTAFIKSLFLLIVIAAVSFGCSSDSSSANNEPSCPMSFTLNGSSFCGKTTIHNVTDEWIEIKSVTPQGGITLSIDNLKGAATYTSGANVTFTTPAAQIYMSDTQTIIVTKDDGSVIEGTFSFKGSTIVGSGSDITVTDGKFYVKR